jgi:hypothetical protein
MDEAANATGSNRVETLEADRVSFAVEVSRPSRLGVPGLHAGAGVRLMSITEANHVSGSGSDQTRRSTKFMLRRHHHS